MSASLSPELTNNWNQKIQLAQQMLPLLNTLHNEHNVVVSVFGRLLRNVTDIDIVKSHRYARRAAAGELPLSETLPVLQTLAEMPLGTASIDMGRLARGFARSESQDLRAYLDEQLTDVLHTGTEHDHHVDVVLYGFGRIGQPVAARLRARGF